MCTVYRVWPTVTGPSGEDARVHHHPWKSGIGTCTGPVSARSPQGFTARPAQHPGHHHHDYNHSGKNHHYHKAHTQQLQKRRTCEFYCCWQQYRALSLCIWVLSTVFSLLLNPSAAFHQHNQHWHPVGGHWPNRKDCRAPRECPGEDSFHLQQSVSVKHDTKGTVKRTKCSCIQNHWSIRNIFITIFAFSSGWGVERDCERRVYALGVSVPGNEACQHWAKLPQSLFQLFGYSEEPRVCQDGPQWDLQEYQGTTFS